MDAPGGRGDADPGGVDPAAAFFGLWPKFSRGAGDVPAGVIPLPPRPRAVAGERPRLRIA